MTVHHIRRDGLKNPFQSEWKRQIHTFALAKRRHLHLFAHFGQQEMKVFVLQWKEKYKPHFVPLCKFIAKIDSETFGSATGEMWYDFNNLHFFPFKNIITG